MSSEAATTTATILRTTAATADTTALGPPGTTGSARPSPAPTARIRTAITDRTTRSPGGILRPRHLRRRRPRRPDSSKKNDFDETHDGRPPAEAVSHKAQLREDAGAGGASWAPPSADRADLCDTDARGDASPL